MSDKKHTDRIHNYLDETDIKVCIKESGEDRRGALPEGGSMVKSGKSAELIGLRGKKDIRLIIESRLVQSRKPEDPVGLDIKIGEKMKPDHIEFHSVPGNKFEFHLHFDDPIPAPEVITDIDPEVSHPGGSIKLE